MLAFVKDAGYRIGEFEFKAGWLTDAEKSTLDVLASHYGDVARTPEKLSDEIDLSHLRADVLRTFPGIASASETIKDLLETRYSALILKKSGLAGLDLDQQRRILFLLCLALGWPTPTDRVNRQIIWDIKKRDLPAGQVSTFSENADEAKLHTDTQYFPNPERYTLLYVVRPAEDGGVSLIRDGHHIVNSLKNGSQGDWAFRHLSRTKLPFRIPTSYTKERRQDVAEATFAPIFADKPLIRYRKDTLEAGLKAHPEYDTAENRLALYILENVIGNQEFTTTCRLDADDILLTNNHEGLHGRTEFSDHARHLIRIRISDQRYAS
jgi:alpha-ketoglutarate-dependent taurine dioxygenase